MPAYQDITGKKYNRLTAIKPIEKNDRGEYLWLFQCDCGNSIITRKGNVTSGHTKSCGCLNKELSTKRLLKYNHSQKSTMAGLKHAKEYNPYSGQKTRERQLNGIKRKDNSSGITGVCQRKDGRWSAYLTYRKKRYCDTFYKKQDAINWRKEKEQELGIYTKEGIKP